MKNKTILLVLISFLFVCPACDKHLDINVNPSYPGDADVNMLLPSSLVWSTARLGSDAQLIGSMWSQHYTQNNASNQYNTLVVYSLSTSSYNGIWNSIYSGALADLNIIINKSEDKEMWNYYVIAKIMSAFNYHILTDFYDNIPFTEALKGDGNVSPRYDDSKTVYAGILNLLDEAIAKKELAKSFAPIGKSDFIFNGDIDKWIRFAKTLKFKILMRDFEANRAQLDALLTEGDLLTFDAKIAIFKDVENNSNPLFENDRRKLNTTNNIRAAATLLDYLKLNNDPRLPIFFEPAAAPNPTRGEYAALPYGELNITQDAFPTPEHSRARLAAEDPVYLQSEAESYFLQAEYYARIADAGKAKGMYEKGVKAAFDRWGCEGAADFTKDGGAYAFDPNNMVECIITQKWIASTRCQAWDAFFDINRTGFPKLGTKQTTEAGYIPGQLVPAVSGVLHAGELPRRLLTPKSSSDYNPNAPKVVPIVTKMWWHK